jgi:energy-coupling factor transporter ATP-binding protein EcfA2
MDVTIKNCNNIDNGFIKVEENRLNIKYAINGTGKSTISKAITAFIKDKNNGTSSLNELMPFKHINDETVSPEVLGVEDVKSIKIFDEKYINDFVFQENEILKGSFDIFIQDENYKHGMLKIDGLVQNLKNMLSEDQDIEILINDFDEIIKGFGRSVTNGIHGSSPMAKALKDGNKVINIPEGLGVYEDYIKNESNFKWIKWQLDGKNFINISDNCPYCINDIKEIKPTIHRISEVYNSKNVESLNKLVSVFQRSYQYFSDKTKFKINEFISNISGYTDDQIKYLLEVKEQIDNLKSKFLSVKELGFGSLKDVDKVIESIQNHMIDIDLFNHLTSEHTKSKVKIVNSALSSLIKEAGELQGGINKQKKLIEGLVRDNNEKINHFLINAGYKYKVNLVEDESGEYKLKLIHKDQTDEISNVKTHLSFGERNALALVLFMYDALKENPGMIVLDDPISSFDKNKKYAIIDMLFRKEMSLKGKTVLLLTHDIEPIVDMVYLHTDRFLKPFASFMENNNGQLREHKIEKSDIKTFMDVVKGNLRAESHELNKLVHLRRLYEITNDKSLGYQLISNLLHKRHPPVRKDTASDREMTEDEKEEAINEIKSKVTVFDYENLIDLVNNDSKMIKLYQSTDSNYEKLHLYRIIFDDKAENIGSDVILKFINESFHIENNHIYQLDPCRYQLVPQYVIDECNRYIEQVA